MAAPKVQNLAQILAELEPAYAGQRKLFGQQQAAIPGKYAGARTGIEAAKTTGFRDIARGAQARGLAFSGIPIAEQSQYLAEKYLPGMQNLEAQQGSEVLQLQMALAELDKDKRLRGVSARGEQQTALQRWQEAERARAFQAQQAQLDRAQRERLEAANRAASAASRASEAPPTLSRNKAGGWDVSGGLDLGGYARATGKDLITLLSQGDKKDRQAAKWYKDNIRLGRGEKYAMERLMYHDRPTAFYRGG